MNTADAILSALSGVRSSAYGSLRVRGERRGLSNDYGRGWYTACPVCADKTRGVLSDSCGSLRFQCDGGHSLPDLLAALQQEQQRVAA